MSGRIVTFNTEDGWKIFGSFYESSGPGSPAIILIHELRYDRDNLVDLAKALQTKGYAVLALDLRGHGASTLRGEQRISFESLKENDFKSMINDLKAAKKFFHGRSVDRSRIGVIAPGTSANLALQFVMEDADISALVLISPKGDMEVIKNLGVPYLVIYDVQYDNLPDEIEDQIIKWLNQQMPELLPLIHETPIEE